MVKKFAFFKIILLIMTTLSIFISCSSKEDEKEIERVVVSFYHHLNKGDYKQVESLMSGNMLKDTKHLRENIKDFIKYKSIDIKDIEINTLTARVVAECVDEFSNVSLQTWALVKQNGDWKMNSFNFSKAESVNNVSTQVFATNSQDSVVMDTIKNQELPLNTETTTENTNKNVDS